MKFKPVFSQITTRVPACILVYFHLLKVSNPLTITDMLVFCF